MEGTFWKIVVRLGVPGLVLGIFYKLYDKFDWPIKNIPPDQMFKLVVIFMLIIAIIVLFTLFLYRPKVERKETANGTAASIPRNCTFKAAAEALAGQHIVEFLGFNSAELSTPLHAKDFVASNDLEAILQLRALADGKIRKYKAEQARSGKYVLRVS